MPEATAIANVAIDIAMPARRSGKRVVGVGGDRRGGRTPRGPGPAYGVPSA